MSRQARQPSGTGIYHVRPCVPAESRKLSAAIMNFIKEIKSSEMVGAKYKA